MIPRETFLNVFFLFRNHYSICDFRFLFGHHNSICDTGLNISGRCLKAFLASLNTTPKILFPLYYKTYIDIYSTDDLNLMYDTLRNVFRSLWCEPSPDKLHEVMQLPQFEDIVKRVLTFEKGSDGDLTINYLKDISFLLSLVSAVRECNIEQHLLAERNVICLAFAYDHQK